MDSDTAIVTLAVLGFSGALGYLLPSLDKTWDANPSAPGTTGAHLASVGKVAPVLAIGAGLIGTAGTKSIWPLGAAVIFVLLNVHVYSEAFNYKGAT